VTTIFPIGDFPLERKMFWSPAIATAIDEVNAYLRSLAAPDVIVFDAYAILSNNGQLRAEYAQDELHLNADGYAALNRELEPVLAAIH
jgi:lysophospholipase L1-like esterase